MPQKQLKLMGRKRGMIQIFDDEGNAVACTVIEAQPNVITLVRTKEKDGYNAIQFSFEEIKVNDPRTIDSRLTKPLQGHYKKANVAPRRFLTELRLPDVQGFEIGQELKVDIFAEIAFVDATAISKGKGYQGVMKRHNFAGGPASHGSGFHRHAGSTGMRSSPGRGLPGGKKAGHMGAERKTIQNLKVIKIQDNIILVKGAVPGPVGGLIYISSAVKKTAAKKA
jgi:large subunit ribosomal protein L3